MLRKTHILYSHYPPIEFIIDGIDSSTGIVNTIEFVTSKRKLLQILILKMGLTRLFPKAFFTKDTIESLKRVQGGDRIIVIDNIRRPIMKAMKKLLPDDVDCHIFLWTPIYPGKRSQRRLRERAKIFHLSSFDENVRLIYPNINIESSFYRFPPAIMMNQVAMYYDCLFIGYEKGRSAILANIRNDIERAGLKPKFLVFKRGEKPIDYRESLDILRHGRCIVDVTLSTKGMSLRPLEALYFRKKLITNNPDIVKERLYHPQNVFIWGVDNPMRLHEFVYSPLYDMPPETLRYYDINTWVERFGTGCVNSSL